MLTEEQLMLFIKSHWEHLTIQDIIAETGHGFWSVRSTCKRLGLKPIGPKDQCKMFIMENRASMTAERIRQLLDISRWYFATLCTELGLAPTRDFIKEPEKKKIAVRQTKSHSPGEILGAYRLLEAIHPHTEISEEMVERTWQKAIAKIKFDK